VGARAGPKRPRMWGIVGGPAVHILRARYCVEEWWEKVRCLKRKPGNSPTDHCKGCQQSRLLRPCVLGGAEKEGNIKREGVGGIFDTGPENFRQEFALGGGMINPRHDRKKKKKREESLPL